jgi:small subunit ribosomal protein S16
MAVKIRLSRVGKKNRPYWRIVALDSKKKRDGACLENLGTYDPIKHVAIELHAQRIQEWVGKGAECSPAVIKILKKNAESAQKA